MTKDVMHCHRVAKHISARTNSENCETAARVPPHVPLYQCCRRFNESRHNSGHDVFFLGGAERKVSFKCNLGIKSFSFPGHPVIFSDDRGVQSPSQHSI